MAQTPTTHARNSAHPCQTIGFALTQQAASHAGGTISVAAGTYTEQVSITPANDGVKLTGAGATTVIQPPSSGLLSDTDTDSGEPQYYVVDVAPGTTGVHLDRAERQRTQRHPLLGR